MIERTYKNLLALSLVVLATGCSLFGFSPSWRSIPLNVPESTLLKSYTLGNVYVTKVGSRMLQATRGSQIAHYEAVDPNILAWKKRSLSGHVWDRAYVWPQADGDYVLTSESYYRRVIGVIVNEDGSLPEDPIMRIDGKGSKERYPVFGYDSISPIFVKRSNFIESKGNFKFELIYTGSSDDQLTIVYREFIDDLSRSSFYQNLTYDLSESKFIQFRSLRIELLGADNTEVKFRVVDDGDLEWMP